MDKGVEKKVFSQFIFGDMKVRYILEEKGHMDLQILPLSRESEVKEFKFSRGDSLIQAKIIGDDYPGTYAGGMTMRNSGTVEKLKFLRQEKVFNPDFHKTEIKSYFEDGNQHTFIHILGYTDGDFALDSKTLFINHSEKKAGLEFISSFSLSEITPFEEGEVPNSLKFHRIRSKWSHEARLVTETAEDLQLEPSWVYWHPNSVRYGQVGSMTVKQYSPFGAVEDVHSGVIWAAQLAIEGSWQMEFYRRDAGLAFSGGLADREFGHWLKYIEPGQEFTTPTAILSVCDKGIDDVCQRLTQYGKKFLGESCNFGAENGEDKSKADERRRAENCLPILFNEYCTTWGNPSQENVTKILEAIKGHQIDYFVIDCGWFLEEGKDWGNSMGDYIPSKKLFPNGLMEISDKIHAAGMKSGLWFEIDNVGKFAEIYNKVDWLLLRDGIPITTQNRRFLDMRKADVWEYLTKKVIGQLRDNDFDYIKMDYNDTYGIGCDGAESLGEGLRQDREASVNFVRKIRRELPNLVIENCASGGHKLEPLMMSLCDMASFSDAHECLHIPVIAAGLHRCILPQQSQIWVVIRKNDSLQRLAYSISTAFLGRMCFSGDVTELSCQQWEKIDQGIAFYKKIVPAIRDGYTYFYGDKKPSDRELEGWQGIVRVRKEKILASNGGCGKRDGEFSEEISDFANSDAYAVFHIFKNPPAKIVVNLPKEVRGLKISECFKGSNIRAKIQGNKLIVYPDGEFESLSLILAKSCS